MTIFTFIAIALVAALTIVILVEVVADVVIGKLTKRGKK